MRRCAFRDLYHHVLTAVLLVCVGAALAPAAAQAPLAAGDRVRVLTQTAPIVGRLSAVTDDSLVLAHRDPRFASPMTIEWRMIQRLRVSEGRQNRTEPTLIGVAAGALVGGLCFLGVDQNGPWSSSSSWLRPYCYAMPLAGGVIGFVTGGEKWREAKLPAQKSAEARSGAEPQHQRLSPTRPSPRLDGSDGCAAGPVRVPRAISALDTGIRVV